MASQVIMLSLAGIPGIYIHSLFGSSNCLDCVSLTGRARSINREKFNWQNFSNQLDNPESRAAKRLSRYKQIVDIRRDKITLDFLDFKSEYAPPTTAPIIIPILIIRVVLAWSM